MVHAAGRQPAGLRHKHRSPPTFYEHAQQSLLEVHVLDFDGDLYGCEVRVEFVDFLRSERKFEGLAQLSEQLAVDVSYARGRLGLA